MSLGVVFCVSEVGITCHLEVCHYLIFRMQCSMDSKDDVPMLEVSGSPVGSLPKVEKLPAHDSVEDYSESDYESGDEEVSLEELKEMEKHEVSHPAVAVPLSRKACRVSSLQNHLLQKLCKLSSKGVQPASSQAPTVTRKGRRIKGSQLRLLVGTRSR